MSHISQRVLQMQMLQQRCAPLLGVNATEFLLRTIPMLDWLDAARAAWNEKYRNAPMRAMAEDHFLEYFTQTQLGYLRHILDQDMVPNDKRKEGMVFVLATLGGMTYAEALKASADLGSDEWLNMLLVPEPTSKPN